MSELFAILFEMDCYPQTLGWGLKIIKISNVGGLRPLKVNFELK